MDITREMVSGYMAVVTAALEAAGHKVDTPTIDPDDLHTTIILPEAFRDAFDVPGLALTWAELAGWGAALSSPDTGRLSMHRDLRLGAVPAPEVIVQAVKAIEEAGALKAGRVAPDTAELLAQYEGGRAPAPTTLDLIALTEGDDGFGQCVVCGGETPTHFGLFVSETGNAPHRTAWCGEVECQGDRAQSMLQTVPVEKIGGVFRVSVAAAERELRAARRDRAERVRSEGDVIRDRLHKIAESLDA